MQQYESDMGDILDDHTTLTNQKVWSVDVSVDDPINSYGYIPSRWSRHILEFRTGILKNP